MEAAPQRHAPPLILIGIALIGAAVSVALGVYGNDHDPTGSSILDDGLFFSGTLNMKVWLATIAAIFALFQILSASWMYGKLPLSGEVPAWLPTAHRVSGTLAFLVTLPVAYHCLWALGFQFDDVPTRVAAHSLLGCAFYGAFTTKMLLLRLKSLPGVLLPLAGGLTFSILVAIWATSSLWFFQNIGFPEF